MTDDPVLATTRASYDATAALYARSVGTEINDSIEAALDRSVLEDLAALFDDVARRLASSGFDVRSCAVREPELVHESTAQAFMFAQLRSTGATMTRARQLVDQS